MKGARRKSEETVKVSLRPIVHHRTYPARYRAQEVTMAEYALGIKLRHDGSIDFDAYKSKAATERKQARDRFVWDVALPLFWGAPFRLVRGAASVVTGWRSAARTAQP